MKDVPIHSSGLTERLERMNKVAPMSEDHPFYWYFHLESLGKRAQTKDLVDAAVKNFDAYNPHYTILKVTSKRFLTRELCEIAVSKNGLNLKYVPEQYQDVDMCRTAVQNDGCALQEVPKEILLGKDGYKICLTAVCHDFVGAAITYVPDDFLHGKKVKLYAKRLYERMVMHFVMSRNT